MLRFSIQFGDSFPEEAPIITFSTDLFHPLVVPLTQYTFSAGALDNNNTTSASDASRLPPGAFSLRHGFPQWFKSSRSPRSSIEGKREDDTPADSITDHKSTTDTSQNMSESRETVLQILKHLKDAFENAALLDGISLAAVGNPSAWHAWRAYRGLSDTSGRGRSPTRDGQVQRLPSSPKQMSEWNWDGVWESRIRNVVDASVSEAGLFSNQGLLKFAKVDGAQLQEIRQQIQAR